MIIDYINSMQYSWTDKYDGTKNWIFYGDGVGDHEQLSDSANIEVVKDYIEYCHRQIELAHEYIKSQT